MSEERPSNNSKRSLPFSSLPAKKSVSNLALSAASLSIDSSDHSASSSSTTPEASLPAVMDKQQFDTIKAMFATIQQTVHSHGQQIDQLRKAQPNADTIADLVNHANAVQPFVPPAVAADVRHADIAQRLRYALTIGQPMPMHIRQEVVNVLVLYDGSYAGANDQVKGVIRQQLVSLGARIIAGSGYQRYADTAFELAAFGYPAMPQQMAARGGHHSQPRQQTNQRRGAGRGKRGRGSTAH